MCTCLQFIPDNLVEKASLYHERNNLKNFVISHNFTSKCFNSLIRKRNKFTCNRSRMHCGIDKFWFTCVKLITTIELQYYVNLRANFNPNKFENFSIQFEKKSIISIRLFFNMMDWKWPSNHFQNSECFIYVEINSFSLIHKADFSLANVNLPVSKFFATYPVNFISRNKYTW